MITERRELEHQGSSNREIRTERRELEHQESREKDENREGRT